MMIRIDAPHFIAGARCEVVEDDLQITEVAPIIKYMIGWHLVDVYAYCERKHWKWLILK